jgi:MFS family permease
MGEDAFAAWGWRIPFLLSAGLLGVSLWIRLRLDESPLFRQMQDENRVARAPLSEAFFRWQNLRLVLLALFSMMMGQGVVWYTANFYAQFFLERVIKVEPRVVNLLIMAALVGSAILHLFFAWLSDRVGRKPIMLFGLALATVALIPGFKLLTAAVNPALAQAAQRAPVVVVADPGDCAVQFDPVGKTKFTSSCDIAKSTLTAAGIPYTNDTAQPGTLAHVRVGSTDVASVDGTHLSSVALAEARKAFDARTKAALTAAGYPSVADTAKIDAVKAILILLVFMLAAAALYGPQAAALVELFPARIRYSGLSLPYHIGNGWFGGFLPATAFAIVAATGNIYAGLWYPVIIAAIGLLVMAFFLPETRGRDISR